MTPKPYPWSYSAMGLFETCPRKYHHLKILKDFKEPESQAILYGNQFHKAAELYIKNGTELPPMFKYALPILMQLKNLPGEKICEQKLGLTEALEPCGFFDKNVWWRGAADLVIISEDGTTARVLDYKTGNNTRYADTSQLELLSLALFKHYPKLVKIKGALVYVVCNAFIRDEYEVVKTPQLWGAWMKRYERLEAACETGVWNPSPSGLCKQWCIVESCEHNGKNK